MTVKCFLLRARYWRNCTKKIITLVKLNPSLMKKMLVILTAACIGFTSCQKNQSTASISKEEVSKAVAELFDGFNSSFKNKDISAMGNVLSDDGLYLGTDPGEYWNKQQVIDEVRKMAKD